LDCCSGNHEITVRLDTLGCKLNQAETEFVQKELEGAGCRIVARGEKADVYILNSCAVTHIADRKSRHLLRMARRANPNALIVATGCYAERSARELSEMKGVNLVIGNKGKLELPKILFERGYLKANGRARTSDCTNRTRSFIKVQDGCTNFCTYCVVPLTRGAEKSLPPDEIINAARQRVAAGYREIVLTGTEIGRYCSGGMDLRGLVKRVLSETEIDRLRLSSLQLQELDPEFIRLWRNPRLCRHFHLSLQSGSDTVLRRMGRYYSARNYLEAMTHLRSAIPGVAITTDVIVGFPGETEEEFIESFDFCRRIQFARIHVFPYSPRKGTRAAEMPGQLGAAVKRQRCEKMLELAEANCREHSRSLLGSTLAVLFEKRSKQYWEGLTDTYVRVYVRSDDNLNNRIAPVEITSVKVDGVAGNIAA
jgi:threonylcarbamoyladenosine tRNA methylthiotransferase MtaB